MDINSLRPATEFAQQFGVKCIIYGTAGSGKTPVAVNTAPNPILLATEPGMLTLKGSQVPTFPAFNPVKIDEFMQWFLNSQESRKFNTLIIDSGSQAMELYVDMELNKGSQSGNKAHGQAAYGNAARAMMKHLNALYFMQGMNIVLICKQVIVEQTGSQYARPYWPGRELPVRTAHLYDLTMRLGKYNIPGYGDHLAFRTKESYDMMARDRSGNLAEYEPPNLSAIFAKCLA